MSILEMRK